MFFMPRLCLFLWIFSVLPAHAATPPISTIDAVQWTAGKTRATAAWHFSSNIETKENFSVALWVRLRGNGTQYPSLAANKNWDGGEVVDLLSTSNMGITLSTGTNHGWVLAVQPNGSWLWNVGNGKQRLDYLPTVQRQPILDERWHLLSFCIDQQRKEARLFYDGQNVAIYALNGFDNLQAGQPPTVGGDRLEDTTLVDIEGQLTNARYWDRSLSDAEMLALYQERFPDARPPSLPESVEELKVLSWNIWHGARHPGVHEGIGQAVDFIKHTDADVVTMQETYGSGPIIADRLGYYFYLRSSNLSIMSRYPIEETHDLYEPFRLGGAAIRLAPAQRVNIFSLWIHYLPAWRQDVSAEGATAQALVAGEWRTRASELRDILQELKPFIEQSDHTPLIVGGDFNSPSKLDWTAATADWHQGLVVDWPVSQQMLNNGFVDSYRHIHRDPTQHEPHELFGADARWLTRRIDYIYTRGKLIDPIDAWMMNTHNGTWPSDHPAVLSTLRLKRSAMRVISYNVLEGFRNKASENFPSGEQRRQLVSGWLAQKQPDLVGFQELNGYSQQRLQREAAVWGHSYAATLKEDGYIVGLTSRYPIEVVERLLDGMHHGLLHCRTAGLDCFVVHLSPFRYRHRQREVAQIVKRVKQAMATGRSVLVLGDFNALSPADRANYDNDQALLRRLRESDARHDHVENLNQDQQIDYSVIQSMLDVGLVDLYAKHRDNEAPTKRRIDYIFASPELARGSESGEWFVTEEHRTMSDHVPVSVDIRLPKSPPKASQR